METATHPEPSFDGLSIEEKLKKVSMTVSRHSRSECSIYRVPWYVKEEKKVTDFMPRFVSLGPYHHGSAQLADMQFHKYRALCCMLERENHTHMYFSAVGELEQQPRACYEGNLDHFTIGKFVEMLVLDGCFIVEILLGMSYGFVKLGYPREDPVFSSNENLGFIFRDMILLENQIPWFVLLKIFNVRLQSLLSEGTPAGLVTLLWSAFTLTARVEPVIFHHNVGYIVSLNVSSCSHLLSALRKVLMLDPLGLLSSPEMRLKYSRDQDPSIEPSGLSIPSATQLSDLWIKFKKAKRGFPNCYIIFAAGTLEITQITIRANTESIYHNLVAFERRHLPHEVPNITSFIVFMDKLVKSTSDVAQLVQDGIIVHSLGRNEEVVNMFNRLARGIDLPYKANCLAQVYEEVNRYCKKRWWRGNLRDLARVAIIVGVIEVLLGILQMYCGFAQLKQQHT